jgi:dihydrofolate synthase/folylpolyglutamate synthase
VTRLPEGTGPDRRQRDAAEQAAASARLREVYTEILDRAPEHDLVPSLDRIAAVCELMGDPQKTFRVVHLTGTNGKTSTTRMVERLLREHGLRTGRFTSPHLADVRERISLDGVPLTAQRFVEVYDEVLPYIDLVDARLDEQDLPRVTYFEVLVAMAYAAFADAPVDVAVVEVGMGGSWDATNVAAGEVAVVTPIAIDHERFLGRDVATIATEKAGIIKPGAVAVLGQQLPEAAEVLLQRAAALGARVVREGIEFGVADRELGVGGQLLTLQGLGGSYRDVFLPLFGPYQAHNAACALAAVEAFLRSPPPVGGTGGAPHPDDDGGLDPGGSAGWAGLDPDVVRAAFEDVDSPGRLEVVRRSPTVLVDAAHNPAGAQALAEAIRDGFSFTRLVGVVAVLSDKDAYGIFEALEPILDEVVVTRSSSPRSTLPEDLAEVAGDLFGEHRVTIAQRLDEAIDVAVGLAEGDGQPSTGILATGSITLVADVRALFGAR